MRRKGGQPPREGDEMPRELTSSAPAPPPSRRRGPRALRKNRA
jgi:hypothetical protein